MRTKRLGRTGLEITPRGVWGLGRWAAAVTPSDGGRRTTRSRWPRSSGPSTWASTGWTRRPSTALATPRRSSGVALKRILGSAPAATSSPSAASSGRNAAARSCSTPRGRVDSSAKCEASLRRLGVDAIDLYADSLAAVLRRRRPRDRPARGGVGRAGRAEAGREGPPHRRVELQRGRPGARQPGSRRSNRCSRPYSLLRRADRGGRPAVLPRARHRRHRLLADAGRAAERHDDARASRVAARGRLAEADARVPGAAPVEEPGVRRGAAGGRRRATASRRARWPWPGRSVTPR